MDYSDIFLTAYARKHYAGDVRKAIEMLSFIYPQFYGKNWRTKKAMCYKAYERLVKTHL